MWSLVFLTPTRGSCKVAAVAAGATRDAAQKAALLRKDWTLNTYFLEGL